MVRIMFFVLYIVNGKWGNEITYMKYNTAKLAGEPLETLGGGDKPPYRPSPKDMRNFFDDYRFELVIT